LSQFYHRNSKKNNKFNWYPSINPIEIKSEEDQHYNTQDDKLKDVIVHSNNEIEGIQYSILFKQGSKFQEKRHSPILTSLRHKNERYSSKSKEKQKPKPSKILKVRIPEEKKEANLKQEWIGNHSTKDFLSTNIPETAADSPPENTDFYNVIKLSLFGNSSKINWNFKFFKNQPSLQSLCSMIPNQPAQKRDKRGEFLKTMNENSGGYTALDPYEPESKLYALESIFENRPSTLFFQYLPQCGKIRDIYRVKKCSKTWKIYYKITDNWNHYTSVTNALWKAGVAMTDEDDWNLYLGNPKMTKEEIK